MNVKCRVSINLTCPNFPPTAPSILFRFLELAGMYLHIIASATKAPRKLFHNLTTHYVESILVSTVLYLLDSKITPS